MRAAETEVTAIKLPLVRVCDADYKRRQDKENCSEHTLNVTGAGWRCQPGAITPLPRKHTSGPPTEGCPFDRV